LFFANFGWTAGLGLGLVALALALILLALLTSLQKRADAKNAKL